jgi:protein-tyrosine phosphatase
VQYQASNCVETIQGCKNQGECTMTSNPLPILKSYWVIPGRFRAGEYPGGIAEQEIRGKIQWLLEQGVDFFLDLTEKGEYPLKPYTHFLQEEADGLQRTALRRQVPIVDYTTPSKAKMIEILNMIDKALSAGRNIYLHCLGGQGRTGMVVGCYLVRHGVSAEQALEKIQELRRGTPNENHPSPENESQRRMVKQWIKGQ